VSHQWRIEDCRPARNGAEVAHPAQVSARINQLSARVIHIDYACNASNMLILMRSFFE
jgi:hypothetical protein